MSQENVGSDVLELTRRTFAAANRRDYDAMMTSYGSDSVWDVSPLGLGTYVGPRAIRAFFEDWTGALEQWTLEVQDLRDLGNGIVLVIAVQTGVSAGGGARVQLRHASLFIWSGDVIMKAVHYWDVEEAIAAARTIAEERR